MTPLTMYAEYDQPEQAANWQAGRDRWVRLVPQNQLRAIMGAVEKMTAPPGGAAVKAEMGGAEPRPTMERAKAECLLWLGTRGQEGKDWGLPHLVAVTLGYWPLRPS
jgi:hypothetical protein